MIDNIVVVEPTEFSSATHETPSVAPSEGDESNSLVDDESVEENGDQVLEEWSDMFPKMMELIATLN